MMPWSPAMMFWSIVGQASRQTAGPMGSSTRERSNGCAGFCGGAAMAGLDSETDDGPAAMATSSASTTDSGLHSRLEPSGELTYRVEIALRNRQDIAVDMIGHRGTSFGKLAPCPVVSLTVQR